MIGDKSKREVLVAPMIFHTVEEKALRHFVTERTFSSRMIDRWTKKNSSSLFVVHFFPSSAEFAKIAQIDATDLPFTVHSFIRTNGIDCKTKNCWQMSLCQSPYLISWMSIDVFREFFATDLQRIESRSDPIGESSGGDFR